MRPTPTKDESRSLTEQTRESKRDDKQPIEKKDADNQLQGDTSHRGEKRVKEEESGREKKSKLNKYSFF